MGLTREEAKHSSAYFLYEFESERRQKCESFIDGIYDDFKLELEAEYKRGWKDRATQSDFESRTCNNCKSKHCDIKTALIKSDSINPNYFCCNDWEQK